MSPQEQAREIVAPFYSKTHGGIVAWDQWGDAEKLVEAIAAALAASAAKHHEEHCMRLGEELNALTAKLEAVTALYEEYLAFINDANSGMVFMAWNHGWRAKQEDIDKGNDYRARILALASPEARATGEGAE